jgi:hypothetical protein
MSDVADSIKTAFGTDDTNNPPPCGSDYLSDLATDIESIYSAYENSPCETGYYDYYTPCPSMWHPIDSMEFLDQTGIYDKMKSSITTLENYFTEC